MPVISVQFEIPTKRISENKRLKVKIFFKDVADFQFYLELNQLHEKTTIYM